MDCVHRGPPFHSKYPMTALSGPKVLLSFFRSHPNHLLVTIALILLSISHFLRFRLWNFDDSYIVFRMVRNIIEGNGWRYNIGELHNASTSVLNTAILSLVSLVTGDIPLAAHLVGALSILVSSLLVFALFRTTLFTAAFGSVLLSFSLANNLTWGLETHLFVALSATYLLLEGTGRNSWWVIGLMILARPDAILLAVLKCLLELWERRKIDPKGIVMCGALVAPWAAYSLFTFGQVFPATLSNKVWQGRSGFWGHGWIYLHGLSSHIISSGLVSVLMTLGALLELSFIIFRGERYQRGVLLFSLFAGAQQCAYIVLNVPPYHWYFSLFDFAVIILSTSLLTRVLGHLGGGKMERWGRRLVMPATTTLLLMTISQLFVSFNAGSNLDRRDEGYTKAIRAIEETPGLPPGPVAALEVGTIGYHTRRDIIDLVGLTSANPEFISGHYNDLFFSLLPPIVVVHSPVWHQERALYDDIRFSLAYEKRFETDDAAFPLQMYVRKAEGDLTSLLKDKEGIARLIATNYDSFAKATSHDFRRLSHPAVQCITDRINATEKEGAATLQYPLIRVRGWAADIESKKAPTEVLLVLLQGDTVLYSAPANRHERQDVALHLGGQEYLNSGFSGEAGTTGVTSGDYSLGIAQRRDRGDFVVCALPGTLRIP